MSDNLTIEKVRAAHRTRVQFDPTFLFDVKHEEEVLDLVRAVLAGDKPRPEVHWHADEERGMCLICDAAGALDLAELLDELEGEDRTPRKSVRHPPDTST